MGTVLEDRVSEGGAPLLETAELECEVCGMPSLGPPMQHYLNCPRHDPETCHACTSSAPPKREQGYEPVTSR